MYYIIDSKTGSQQPCAVVPRVTIRNLREVFSTLDKGVEPCVAHAAFPTGETLDVEVPLRYRSNSLGREAALYRRLAYLSETLLGRYVDGFVFITEGLREFYAKVLKGSMRISQIIPSGVDLNLFRPHDPAMVRERYSIPDDEIILGYAGVISRERELDFPIRALAEARDKGPGLHMLFVGDGDDRSRLEGIAHELGIADRVKFTGKIAHEMMPGYISSFDLGLCHLPDTLFFRQSFPMKVLEYAACGIRVAASRIRAHEDIARELPLLLYQNNDPGDLARILTNMDRTPARIPEKIERYSWENIVGEISNSYREALSRDLHVRAGA